MTTEIECACGATLTIEDASELATTAVLGLWNEHHGQHRHTPDERRALILARAEATREWEKAHA